MEDVEFKSQGFLPRGSNYYNTFMHVSTREWSYKEYIHINENFEKINGDCSHSGGFLSCHVTWNKPSLGSYAWLTFCSFSAVCTVEQDTLKTFDDVEIQHTLPDRCMHVLAKDCTKNNSFIVLMSKDTRHPDKKIIEILVEQEKIRIAHLGSAGYQIQVRIYIFSNFFWFPYFCLIFFQTSFFRLFCTFTLDLNSCRLSAIFPVFINHRHSTIDLSCRLKNSITNRTTLL